MYGYTVTTTSDAFASPQLHARVNPESTGLPSTKPFADTPELKHYESEDSDTVRAVYWWLSSFGGWVLTDSVHSSMIQYAKTMGFSVIIMRRDGHGGPYYGYPLTRLAWNLCDYYIDSIKEIPPAVPSGVNFGGPRHIKVAPFGITPWGGQPSTRAIVQGLHSLGKECVSLGGRVPHIDYSDKTGRVTDEILVNTEELIGPWHPGQVWASISGESVPISSRKPGRIGAYIIVALWELSEVNGDWATKFDPSTEVKDPRAKTFNALDDMLTESEAERYVMGMLETSDVVFFGPSLPRVEADGVLGPSDRAIFHQTKRRGFDKKLTVTMLRRLRKYPKWPKVSDVMSAFKPLPRADGFGEQGSTLAFLRKRFGGVCRVGVASQPSELRCKLPKEPGIYLCYNENCELGWLSPTCEKYTRYHVVPKLKGVGYDKYSRGMFSFEDSRRLGPVDLRKRCCVWYGQFVLGDALADHGLSGRIAYAFESLSNDVNPAPKLVISRLRELYPNFMVSFPNVWAVIYRKVLGYGVEYDQRGGLKITMSTAAHAYTDWVVRWTDYPDTREYQSVAFLYPSQILGAMSRSGPLRISEANVSLGDISSMHTTVVASQPLFGMVARTQPFWSSRSPMVKTVSRWRSFYPRARGDDDIYLVRFAVARMCSGMTVRGRLVRVAPVYNPHIMLLYWGDEPFELAPSGHLINYALSGADPEAVCDHYKFNFNVQAGVRSDLKTYSRWASLNTEWNSNVRWHSFWDVWSALPAYLAMCYALEVKISLAVIRAYSRLIRWLVTLPEARWRLALRGANMNPSHTFMWARAIDVIMPIARQRLRSSRTASGESVQGRVVKSSSG